MDDKVQSWIQIMQSTDTPTTAVVGQCTFLLQSIITTAHFKYAQTGYYPLQKSLAAVRKWHICCYQCSVCAGCLYVHYKSELHTSLLHTCCIHFGCMGVSHNYATQKCYACIQLHVCCSYLVYTCALNRFRTYALRTYVHLYLCCIHVN